jgi:hypothetical protein
MSKNAGILYALQNELWGTNLKCGFTTRKIEKRISNLQTSLFVDCGLWIVDCGLWIVDCGLWIVDCGL